MWVLGGDCYTAGEIARFLTEFGTMDDAIVEEGHYFVAEDPTGAILGSGGWTRSRPSYADALGAGPAADTPTVRGVFVDPAAARCGVASAVMWRSERDAAEHGVRSLRLTATLSGVSLYEKLGYDLEEVTEIGFPDLTRFGCVKMRKSFAKL